MYDFDFILDNVENKTVFESLVKAKEMVAHHQNVAVSISGGGRQRCNVRYHDKGRP